MKMYYVTRYEHNPDKKTEYYAGGGRWVGCYPDRMEIRLYTREEHAICIVNQYTQTDWHEIEISP